MNVKGTIITSVKGFVKENFPNRYQEWIDGLPAESKSIFTDSIKATEWYPYQEGLIKPTELIAKLFYHNNADKAAWNTGRYSAEVGLTGIYKVFIFIATPQFVMKRAQKILGSFYEPSLLKLGDVRPKGVDVNIIEFLEPSEITEYRIAGWMEKALELCGEKNITIDITKSLAKGDDMTVYVLNWG